MEGDKLKLSTKGRYGLRALIDLAQYSKDAPVSIMSISARQDISERYLEQLMSMLKKAGLVRSVRGANGGDIFSEGAKEILAGEVVRGFGGSPGAVSFKHLPAPGTERESGCRLFL